MSTSAPIPSQPPYNPSTDDVPMGVPVAAPASGEATVPVTSYTPQPQPPPPQPSPPQPSPPIYFTAFTTTTSSSSSGTTYLQQQQVMSSNGQLYSQQQAYMAQNVRRRRQMTWIAIGLMLWVSRCETHMVKKLSGSKLTRRTHARTHANTRYTRDTNTIQQYGWHGISNRICHPVDDLLSAELICKK